MWPKFRSLVYYTSQKKTLHLDYTVQPVMLFTVKTVPNTKTQ